MAITPYGWVDNGPPELDAENLEAMLAHAGAYTDDAQEAAQTYTDTSVKAEQDRAQAAESKLAGGLWSQPSALGRPAVDLLMSTYDTDPNRTDQTAAFTTALAAAYAILAEGVGKVRIILDSRLKYTIGGAVQPGANGQLAQIALPYSNGAVSGIIELQGIGNGPDWLILPYNAQRTVIESTLGSAPTFAAATGIASVFGGPASYSTNNKGSQSSIAFSVKNVTIRSPHPVVCGIDAGHIAGFFFDGLMFDTDAIGTMSGSAGLLPAYETFMSSMTPTTAPQAIPIIFPLVNTIFGAKGGYLGVAGWMCGPVIGEYLDAAHIDVMFSTGPCLAVDVSSHPNRIGMLGDWDNAYGIASTYPDGTHNMLAPTATGGASDMAAGSALASQLEIGRWDVQTAESYAPAALKRVNDVVDSNNITPIQAKAQKVQGGTGAMLTKQWSFIGSGSTVTGMLSYVKILDACIASGVLTTSPALPASGSWIRNPLARDALVFVATATFSSYGINGATGFTMPAAGQPIFLSAQSSISFVYTGTPAVSWLPL